MLEGDAASDALAFKGCRPCPDAEFGVHLERALEATGANVAGSTHLDRALDISPLPLRLPYWEEEIRVLVQTRRCVKPMPATAGQFDGVSGHAGLTTTIRSPPSSGRGSLTKTDSTTPAIGLVIDASIFMASMVPIVSPI